MKQRHTGILATIIGSAVFLIIAAIYIIATIVGLLGSGESGGTVVGTVLQSITQNTIVNAVWAVSFFSVFVGIWLIMRGGKKQARLLTWETIKEAWVLTGQHIGLLIGITVAIFVASLIISIPSMVMPEETTVAGITNVLSNLVEMYLQFGFVAISIMIVQKKKPKLENLFMPFIPFARMVIASILFGLMVVFGIILFIVPGVYFLMKYQLYPYFIIDKNAGIFDAFNLSAQATQGAKLDMLLLGQVLGLITVASLIPLGLGLLASIPLSAVAGALMYAKLTNQ